MQNVVLYIRVSTEEQAKEGFSLDSQLSTLTRYAKKNKLNVLHTFREDHTAKNGFDRPVYKELKSFLMSNKIVDGILVTQWSRFSRNATESMIELKDLKAKGIEVRAIEQLTDDTVPENLLLKAIHLFMPQVENERLSLRTKAGMRQALIQGRWLWKAPFGYKNNKVTKLIEVDEYNAQIVRYCFETMATGLYTSEEVRRLGIQRGLILSKQGFLNFLQNPIYIGEIKIPAIKDEAESTITGLHLPIITSELYQKVQSILKGKRKPYKGITKNEELPLIGNLICPKCNQIMTGSASKGNGGVYHYYHCQRKYNKCKNSFRASYANTIFENYLKSFEPSCETLELYNIILEDVFKTNGNNQEKEKQKLEVEISLTKERIKNAIMKNLDGIWDNSTFKQTKEYLDSQMSELELKYMNINKIASEYSTYIKYSIPLVANLSGYYAAANVETKKKIVGSIFPEKIYFEENKYRTTKINEVVSFLFNVGKGFKEKQPRKNSRLSSFAPQSGLEPETL